MRLLPQLCTPIRFISFSYGSCVIVASIPLALLSGAAPSETVPAWSPLLTMPATACLLAAGFIFIALFGERMARSRWYCLVAGLLLSAPFATGVLLLLTPKAQRLHPLGLLLLIPAGLAFMCSVWPLRFPASESETTTSLEP